MLKSFRREAPGARRQTDTKFVLRVVVGVLLVANLVAAGIMLFPPGGSAEDLERQLVSLQSQATTKKALLEKTRENLKRVESGRSEGDEFLGSYFLPVRDRSELLLTQLGNAAKDSKIKEKDRSISMEPIDGSDTLSMMSVVANYEGTYADLMHFVHEIDRSSSLMIIESLSAAPQAGTNILSISMKVDTFVRDDGAAGSGAL
jgi:Tfp pilus assembly protein PilO